MTSTSSEIHPVPAVTRPTDQPRRASWGVVAAIAIGTAGAGVIAGHWLGDRRSAPVASATPAVAEASRAAVAPPGAGSQAVYISSARQQLIGVRTAVIAFQHVEGTVRTVGVLAYDETRTAQIHTRISGWVEQLYVNYVGKRVHRGQALFAVYSPDLATAQTDYLITLGAREKLGDTASADLRASADALLQASRERMRRWSVSDAQIDELTRTHKPSRTLAIESPFDGVVLEKDAFAGQYVTPEMTSYKLADLSTLWAVGQVFEYEASRLHVGDAVDVEFPYGQATNRPGKIDFIYPEVDPQTRRIRFRVALDNRDGKLKPDTYVNLLWHGEAQHLLAVPKEAVIDTGPRKYVLLALANGYFAPRDVQIGPPVGDYYPVTTGVTEGERVVTSAQFLVDSETNLMAAMQGMSMAMPGMDMGQPAPKEDSSMPGMDMGSSSAGSAVPMPPMPGM